MRGHLVGALCALVGLSLPAGACQEAEAEPSHAPAASGPTARTVPRLDPSPQRDEQPTPRSERDDELDALPLCERAILAQLSRSSLAPPSRQQRRYRLPSQAEIALLRESLERALAGDWAEAAAVAADAGMRVCRGERDESELVLWRPQDGRLRARAVLRTVGARPLIVEASHPYHDVGTLSQARIVFEQLDARALLVAGSHRCSSKRTTGCSRTANPCTTGPSASVVSDASHSPGTFFHAAHEVLADAHPDHWVLSLHGMSGAGVSISNGVRGPALPGDPVALLGPALQRVFPRYPVTSCNAYPGATVKRRYCGTTNVQGRHLNGSPDACHTRAELSARRFIHLEQSLKVRARTLDVVEALGSVLPP